MEYSNFEYYINTQLLHKVTKEEKNKELTCKWIPWK